MEYSGLRRKFPAEYMAWWNMKAPCQNPKHRQWSRFGGRGIKVCAELTNSFERFLKHVGAKPSPEHRLSRQDLAKDFEPGNVV